MMFNPAKAADEIKKAYMGYISTTYHFRNQEIQRRFEAELKATVSNGPFVEIKDTFVTGKSIEDLIAGGTLSPLFNSLERDKRYEPKLPLSRPLYLHQEKAIEKIVEGKNVVVSTGTGSGKTNCFLIPVINELMREQEAGTLDNGIRAIFIYPMNALANDQIKGLREILMAYPQITFGVYNGGTEHNEADAIKLYEAMYANEKFPELQKRLPNEMLSRDEMKKKPPHILFTNYAMLEHMLFRPGDDVLFSRSKFKFVVLDEAHVYAGATGIETALLMGRLKGRLSGERKPQFILTSATLGDGSSESNERVVRFATGLTGCDFFQDDIVTAYRNTTAAYSGNVSYPADLYIELANEEKFIKDTLSSYKIDFNAAAKDEETIYDLIVKTDVYAGMRRLGGLITLDEFANGLGISRDAAVAFVSLCAKARKDGKPLVDIRYHYFLRALDGGYLAPDYPQSFSLMRKDFYEDTAKMFEVAVCEDCGEIAIIGKQECGRLVRLGIADDREFYQLSGETETEGSGETETEGFESEEDDPAENLSDAKKGKEKNAEFVLCKSCGATAAAEESHNKWCTCGNTQPIRIKRLPAGKCLNCNGKIRKLQLGYEAATSVISTALFEQIPEHTFAFEEIERDKPQGKGLFAAKVEKKKRKEKTSSQFLIFSDSRQGAAKFACFLEDKYKEFLRRRGIWNVAGDEGGKFSKGIVVSEFVSLLDNYFSSRQLFRKSNADNALSSIVENRRNAWVAVLNELYNSYRDTSLVSLGKMKFEYLGNTDAIVGIVVDKYNVSKADAKNFLDYLAMEIVRAGAVGTDRDTDINDADRKYIFFTQAQLVVTKNKDTSLKYAKPFLPTEFQKKNGERAYYRSNKLAITKMFLKVGDDEAMEFLENYWEWLLMKSNPYRLHTKDGKGYFMPASNLAVFIGKDATLWKCAKCQKVTQFNIGGKCIQRNCNGRLERLDAEAFCKDNYYAMLYESKKVSPLFVKEHTAQLAKKEALEYQQQFIRKEINALSCSTTFEMGVDVGDLETVFLRNIPPLASNYAQRVGRAGRSINAAAFALTFARLSSHDFTFFDRPKEMINGIIYPPQFKLDNEKIIKRHIYAAALSLYLKQNPELYKGNNASVFINEKGYEGFLEWLNGKPEGLLVLLKNSMPRELWGLPKIEIETFGWLDDFCGEKGRFTTLIREFEKNIEYLKKERDKALKAKDTATARVFEINLDRYRKNDLIDFLVRGNILPKYGFPVDSVELMQNITSPSFKSLNLSRDLSVAIAEYAPSAEVVADGNLYTSRYIRKPIVNKSESGNFEIAYIAECPDCKHINYRNMPIGVDGQPCAICEKILRGIDFHKSIEPRAGFITEREVQAVPLSSQERKYKTEAIYIGDKNAYPIDAFEYAFGKTKIKVESTANDSLVVKSTERFYVCQKCGYSLASDETSKLNKYSDYKRGAKSIKTGEAHDNPFGKGKCENTELLRYWLHHEFKTDVAKITFETDTADSETMLSVMYALLNAFADTLSIEKRDIEVCLTYKRENGIFEHKIIIYDSVPGGAGHSRRLVTHDGAILKRVIERAIELLGNCNCEPSCYKCLRNYENQKIHEILDRKKALNFLIKLME
jgi:ATP-dependent helicase YprA (DUF1998 family)